MPDYFDQQPEGNAMTIGILVLAAGYSRRFGTDKRATRLAHGGTLLETSLKNARASQLPVIVCLHPGDEALAEQLTSPGITPTICPDAGQGMGASLAWGVGQARHWSGALIALGDMPEVRPATFCKVASHTFPGNICQPTWRGQGGHPVGFGRQFFASLQALTGDTGARSILAANREFLVQLAVNDPGILHDVDRPEDL